MRSSTPLLALALLVGTLGFACHTRDGGAAVAVASARGASLMQLSVAPGPVDLNYRGQSQKLTAFSLNGATVVALPPLDPGDIADITRNGEVLLRVSITAMQSSPAPVGNVTLDYIDNVADLLSSLTAPADASAGARFTASRTAALVSLARFRADVLSAQEGKPVGIPLRAGGITPIDAAGVAVFDSILLSIEAGVYPITGGVPLRTGDLRPLALTPGDRYAITTALVGGAFILTAIATAPAAGGYLVAGVLMTAGGAVNGALMDAVSGTGRAAEAALESAEASQPGPLQRVGEALANAKTAGDKAAAWLENTLTPGSPVANDASSQANPPTPAEECSSRGLQFCGNPPPGIDPCQPLNVDCATLQKCPSAIGGVLACTKGTAGHCGAARAACCPADKPTFCDNTPNIAGPMGDPCGPADLDCATLTQCSSAPDGWIICAKGGTPYCGPNGGTCCDSTFPDYCSNVNNCGIAGCNCAGWHQCGGKNWCGCNSGTPDPAACGQCIP